jgi:hypothetical protein
MVETIGYEELRIEIQLCENSFVINSFIKTLASINV